MCVFLGGGNGEKKTVMQNKQLVILKNPIKLKYQTEQLKQTQQTQKNQNQKKAIYM